MIKNSKALLSSLQAVAGVEVVDIDPAKTEIDPTTLSPIGEDQAFYSYLFPGSIFQANDGSSWQIESMPSAGSGMIRIRNVWYPRTEATITKEDIRKSIDMWIYPQIVVVPTVKITEQK